MTEKKAKRGGARVPIRAAENIAKDYGYDQVVIIARKVGENGVEHCTTYGVDKANCDVAARIGDFLKYKVMGGARENLNGEPFGNRFSGTNRDKRA